MTIVQRTPNLGLTLRMQRTTGAPASTAAAGDSGSSTAGVTWLPTQTLWEAVDRQSVSLGGSLWDINNGWGIPRSIWTGTPPEVDEHGNAVPVLSADFRCVEIEVNTSYWIEAGRDLEYFGVILGGTLVDARWEFEWDEAHLENPAYSKRLHRAEVFGNVIRVVLTLTDGSLESRETLTARAFSGASQVGELKLVAVAVAA